ncbi:MAG: glycerophosphodiester phosphodiesterase [Wenzhouxiangella sp.]|nr:glycerophosphodiester phosphodiesterase [Wenzhouxiangella sp.]
MSNTLIIAHRGASAYLPEHSFEAYLLAYGQGADFIEPDLVMTSDGQLIALHDLTLDATTNVAEVFPSRAREDGRFFAMDFSLEELRRLKLSERIEVDTGLARFPNRWPPGLGEFRIVTLEDLIVWLRELNRATGRRVGLYPETKFPAFHAEAGFDIAGALVEVLLRHDLPDANLPVFIQSFEPEPLERIRARHGDRFALIQLIGANDWRMNTVDYDAMTSATGLAHVASYASGIGPPLTTLIEIDESGNTRPSPLFRSARRLKLTIHPFTFRREGLPAEHSLESLLDLFIHELAIDGLFTDHPDVAVQRRAQSR